MKTVVKIIAADEFLYSLDNGISQTRFKPGGVYEVPDWAAKNFMLQERKWARVATDEDKAAALAALEKPKSEPAPIPEPQPTQAPEVVEPSATASKKGKVVKP